MKMFKNKRGIELSINFIVMLILALAVFSGGMVFATKFFGHAQKVRGTLDAQTEKQIEKLLDSGSPFVIPINTKEVLRNKYATYGLGVLAQFNGRYELTVEFDSAFEKNSKNPITGVSPQDWLSGAPATLDLKKNEKGKYMVLVQVPKGAPSGTYIYKANIRFFGSTDTPVVSDMAQYDNPVQMIVKVR